MAVCLQKLSSLHLAAGMGDVATVMKFLKNEKTEFVGGKKVMVFHLDPTGMSALSLAAQSGHFEVVDLLLRVKVPASSQADVNGRSKAGVTALMLAAQNGHVNIVRTLLEHKADPQLKSEAGDTALHYATRNPDTHTRSEIFSFIQDAGGDASLPNAQGLSASDLLRRGAESSGGTGAAQVTQGERATSHGGGETQEGLEGQKETTAKGEEKDEGKKKCKDVQEAYWDAYGRRVHPETIARELARHRKDRRREAARRKKEQQLEQAYIAITGDEKGFSGFRKVGERTKFGEEEIKEKLCSMGFSEEQAAKAAKENTSLEDAIEWIISSGGVEEEEQEEVEENEVQELQEQIKEWSMQQDAAGERQDGSDMLERFFSAAASGASAGQEILRFLQSQMSRPANFATDTQISSTDYRERELQAFDFHSLQQSDGTIEHFEPQQRRKGMELEDGDLHLEGNIEGWDQFHANEKLFGTATTYKEEIYTSKLDRSRLTEEQIRRAELLAKEIEKERDGSAAVEQEAVGDDDTWATDVHR